MRRKGRSGLLGAIIARLWNIIKWRVSGEKWIGKRVYCAGKMRTVIGETYDFIFLKGLQNPIRKDSRYLRYDTER
jgi:hypothetical protein